MADGVVINKADGENLKASLQAKADVHNALHMQELSSSGWSPKVLTISAIENKGLGEVWRMIQDYQRFTSENGFFTKNREHQKYNGWMKVWKISSGNC